MFADSDLFRFPDSSKLKNDRVNLEWKPRELFGLLLFELLKQPVAAQEIESLAAARGVSACLPQGGRMTEGSPDEQPKMISAIAGEFMGASIKRGRVYSWVPLHLSDLQAIVRPGHF